ncbi:hypothetical protein [Anaerorhabdus sp.]|jgi:lysylphosphatidylglycerol synthetase-like protein (DUF2156 family)
MERLIDRKYQRIILLKLITSSKHLKHTTLSNPLIEQRIKTREQSAIYKIIYSSALTIFLVGMYLTIMLYTKKEINALKRDCVLISSIGSSMNTMKLSIIKMRSLFYLFLIVIVFITVYGMKQFEIIDSSLANILLVVGIIGTTIYLLISLFIISGWKTKDIALTLKDDK